MTRQKWKVLKALQEKGRLSIPEIEELLWGDDPDGGPLYATSIVRAIIAELREAGHIITTIRNQGYAIGKIKPIEPEDFLTNGQRAVFLQIKRAGDAGIMGGDLAEKEGTSADTVRVQVLRIREKIRPLGYEISKWPYRLKKVEKSL